MPKVLVISNNCFAENNSNGRVLGTLFKNMPKDKLAQFYIVNGANNFNVCENYYLVNDSMAIKSWFSKKNVGKKIHCGDKEVSKFSKMTSQRAKYGRTSFNLLIRTIIWLRFSWWSKDIEQWAKEFNPDVVLLQSGDAPFMYEIAYRFSNMLNIPLVQFNTEFSYFQTENFINGKRRDIFFNIFKYILNKKIRKVIQHTSISIYNSEWMKEQYDKEFGMPSDYIYQSSDYRPQLYPKNNKVPKVTYVGNLGLRRHEPLVEIAHALYSFNKEWNLTVYGAIQNEETKVLFDTTPGLIYKGVVSYSKALEAIANSDILVLAEHPDPNYSKTTAYGFSTKITDYLFSGIPILAYGPVNNVGMNYLKNNNVAEVVFSKDNLSSAFERLFSNKEYREDMVKRALNLANKNHDAFINSNRFISILSNVCNNG